MNTQRTPKFRALLILLLVALLTLAGLARAQDVPTDLTPEPILLQPTPLTVTQIQPGTVIAGQAGLLRIIGTNFTAATTVTLVGVTPALASALVSSTEINAALPTTLIPGSYAIQVADPVNGTVVLAPSNPNPETRGLMVLAPTPTNPPPTPAQPTAQPTPQPGQPTLAIRSFSASPSTVEPGGTVALALEIVNQGNRPAEGITISIDTTAKFVPAAGQASAVLGTLLPGASAIVTLNAVAMEDAPAGPNSVPIRMAYRDFTGQTYTANGSVTVSVLAGAEVSQVTLARYMARPNPAVPGEPVTLTLLIMNSGTETARQVLVRVAGTDSVLLPGEQGDSFPIGDLEPGASTSIDVPMIVSADAEGGPQRQPVSITYFQGAESVTTETSLTLQIDAVVTAAPLLLLESYSTGVDRLIPGQTFTLEMTLRNVGSANADEVLVTFGTVESTGGGSTGGGTGGSTGGSGSTSTTPSSTFAPLGGGGTVYVGDLPAGESRTITQEFVINGTTASGIYNLPVALRHLEADGSFSTDNLRASVVVVAPPRLSVVLQGGLPPVTNLGEPLTMSVQITNNGGRDVNLVGASFTIDGGEVLDGADIPLARLPNTEDTSLNGTLMPTTEGTIRITLTIHYLDDLNAPAELTQSWSVEAVQPPPPVDSGPMEPLPVPTEPTAEPTNELLGSLLLGLLGLGS